MNNMKQAFQRKCMACNLKKDKYELIRIVKNKNNEILVDKTGKLDGRGAYICNKSNIDQKIYEDIRGVIIGNEQKNQTNS